MTRRNTFLALPVLLILAAGCDRSTPGAAPPATSSPATHSIPLRDWTLQPEFDPRDDPAAAPERIVCAAPSLTEICCALGLRDRLAARTDYCKHPPGIESLRSIGSLLDVNIEVLLAIKPDLILVAGEGQAIPSRLAPLGVRVESTPDDSLEDLFVTIRQVGALTGRPHTAERLAAAIRDDLEAVARAARKAPPRRILLITGILNTPPMPPFVAGPGSFYDDLFRVAGHTNAAPAGAAPFGELSLETIVRMDPDVIIELDPDRRRQPGGQATARAAWEGLGQLSAVVNDRVRVLQGPEHYLLGPRIAFTLRAICEQMPEDAP